MKRWARVGMLAVLFATVLNTAKAEAVPITGSIGFGGTIAPVANWQTINAIDIIGEQAVVLCNPIMLCTGAFAAFNLPVLQFGTYNDFSFNPLGGNIAPLWSFGGFSFTLMVITNITRAPNGIVLDGTGVLSGGGFDPTPAMWSFSANDTDQAFRFASTTTATATLVPDGGATILLLGVALLGLAAVRRHMQS